MTEILTDNWHLYPPPPPIQTLLFENDNFLLLLDLVCFVLFWFLRFGLSMTTVYPVTTVTENASYQNAFQSGDFWIRLLLVYV